MRLLVDWGEKMQNLADHQRKQTGFAD